LHNKNKSINIVSLNNNKMTILEQIEVLEASVVALKADATKIDAGNKAAKTRVRVGLQDVKSSAQDIRIAIAALGKAE
jgi:hypothetical protein